MSDHHHPDICPYCRAPITAEQRKRIGEQRQAESPCTCPVGFGQVRDPNCPKHGNRAPAHTITGPV